MNPELFGYLLAIVPRMWISGTTCPLMLLFVSAAAVHSARLIPAGPLLMYASRMTGPLRWTPACPLLSARQLIRGCSDPLWSRAVLLLAKVRSDARESDLAHSLLSETSAALHSWNMRPVSLSIPFICVALCCLKQKHQNCTLPWTRCWSTGLFCGSIIRKRL